MILSIWVFFLLGDPLANEHGTPYVQATAPAHVHDTDSNRDKLERTMRRKFEHDFPGHVICESGWCLQPVEVNPV